MIKGEFKIEKREGADGAVYHYADIGWGYHGKKSFRLWVSGRLVGSEDKVLKFPVLGAKIHKTEKGTLVMRPDPNWNVFNAFVRCGYRGGSYIQILNANEGDIFQYEVYRSQTGSLGVSDGVLVNVPAGKSLQFDWQKDGRLYGRQPKGSIIIEPDGAARELGAMSTELNELKEVLS